MSQDNEIMQRADSPRNPDVTAALDQIGRGLVALAAALTTAPAHDLLVREHDAASLAAVGVTARWMADRGRRGVEGFVRTPKDGWCAPRSIVLALLSARRRRREPAPVVQIDTRASDRAALTSARRVAR